jgi:hypothetical protein
VKFTRSTFQAIGWVNFGRKAAGFCW